VYKRGGATSGRSRGIRRQPLRCTAAHAFKLCNGRSSCQGSGRQRGAAEHYVARCDRVRSMHCATILPARAQCRQPRCIGPPRVEQGLPTESDEHAALRARTSGAGARRDSVASACVLCSGHYLGDKSSEGRNEPPPTLPADAAAALGGIEALTEVLALVASGAEIDAGGRCEAANDGRCQSTRSADGWLQAAEALDDSEWREAAARVRCLGLGSSLTLGLVLGELPRVSPASSD